MTAMLAAANRDFNLYGKLVKVDQLLDSVADRSYSHDSTVFPWALGWATSDITVLYANTTIELVMYIPYRISGGTDPLAWMELQYSQNAGVSWTKVSRVGVLGDHDSNNHDCFFHRILIPNIAVGNIRFRVAYATLLSGGLPTIVVNPTVGAATSAFYSQFIAFQYASYSVTGSVARKIAEFPRGKETSWTDALTTEGETTFSSSHTISFPNVVKSVGSGIFALLRIPAGMVTVLGPTALQRMIAFTVEYSRNNGASWTTYGTTSRYGTSGGSNDQMPKYRHTVIPVWLPTPAGTAEIKFRVTVTADTSTTSGYQVNRGLTNSSPFRAASLVMEVQA